MATHSSILAWRISWTQEPGRLQSMGSQESDTTERLSAHTHHIKTKNFHIKYLNFFTFLKLKYLAKLTYIPTWHLSFDWSSDVCSSDLQFGRPGFYPWVGKIPWRRKWQPTLVFLPGKSHGQKRLTCYSPWGRKSVRHDLATKQQQPMLTIAV